MNYRISIPKPCHEDWDNMTPDRQGRFCSQCAKTVTDFTGMSALEIQSYLLANSGQKVCGRFTATQLDKVTITIPESILYSQTRFRNVFLLALLVTMGTTLLSCNNGQKIDKVAIEKDSTAVPHPGHTVGMIATPDSLPPPPKPCGPAKDGADDRHKTAISDKTYINGAVAIKPVPPPEGIVGEIVMSPETDSIQSPSKVQQPKANPGDAKKQGQ